MTDRQLKALIKKLFVRWVRICQLDRGWEIRLSFDEEADRGNVDTLAQTWVDWEYMNAGITFHLPAMRTAFESTIENAVVHELCHILLAQGVDGAFGKNVERSTTMVTNALLSAAKPSFTSAGAPK